MFASALASSTPGGAVHTQTRKYTDSKGAKHRVVFRQIDHGHGVKIYDIELDGVQLPRLDHTLFHHILNLSEECLAHYFENR